MKRVNGGGLKTRKTRKTHNYHTMRMRGRVGACARVLLSVVPARLKISQFYLEFQNVGLMGLFRLKVCICGLCGATHRKLANPNGSF